MYAGLLLVVFSANGIGGAGAAAIADALKLNTAITSVALGCECVAFVPSWVCGGLDGWWLQQQTGIDRGAGATAIAATPKLNTSITSVNLACECRAGASACVRYCPFMYIVGFGGGGINFSKRHWSRQRGRVRGGNEVEHNSHEHESGM